MRVERDVLQVSASYPGAVPDSKVNDRALRQHRQVREFRQTVERKILEVRKIYKIRQVGERFTPVDSQTVKGADTAGRDTRGYDAGKKINGRKRFIVTDTLGLLLVVVVLSAAVQDRDGAKPALLEIYLRTPVRFLVADAGFAGRLLDGAQTILRTTLHIVRKPSDQRGFAVIPRRWAVERTLAWLTAHRRLARDDERDPAVSEAMIRWAAINTITRRIARGVPATRQQRREFTTTS
jgi:transposase